MSDTTIRIHTVIRRELTPNRSFRTPRGMIYALQKKLKQDTVRAFREQMDLEDPVACLQTAPWPVILDITVARAKRKQALDDDNMVASLKYLQDGVAQALGMDDKHMHIARPVTQVRDPDGAGYIDVTIKGNNVASPAQNETDEGTEADQG